MAEENYQNLSNHVGTLHLLFSPHINSRLRDKLLCKMPLHFHSLGERDINYILVMGNSSMNPFVFVWRLDRYRKAFAKILTCERIVQRLSIPSVPAQETFL